MPTSAPTELRMREEKEISPSPQSIGMAPPTAEPINTPPQISDLVLIIKVEFDPLVHCAKKQNLPRLRQ